MDKDIFLESAQFNYCFDPSWLIEQYPSENRNKSLLLVHGSSNDLILKSATTLYSNIKLCKAKVEMYGTHHTKMMLLIYKTGMRVIIHTVHNNIMFYFILKFNLKVFL